jgi:alkylated DNA nucleotide flippase Atl1
MTSEKQPFVPVPQKPTHDMVQATLPTVRSIGNLDQATAGRIIHAVYDLMIETAPPPPGVRLSDKQHKVLTAICQMYDKDGKVPSHRQVAEAIGLPRSTTSTTIRQLTKLRYIKPAPLTRRVDGQGYAQKQGYAIAIRPDPYR